MRYTFYLDEAGDEGIDTGGTDWFVIGGILVRKEDDLQVARTVNRVKEAIGQRDPRRPLHWAELKRHHEKRLYVAREFARLPIRLIVCATHKPSLREKAVFKRKQWLYNFVTRHVIERVSWLVRDETEGQGHVDLVFEKRSNLSYEVLERYLDTQVRVDAEVCDAVLGRVIPRGKDQSKNLQIADALVGACFGAFEPNRFGQTDPTYVQIVRSRLYRRQGNLMSYGLKLLPYDFATDGVDGLEWLDGL